MSVEQLLETLQAVSICGITELHPTTFRVLGRADAELIRFADPARREEITVDLRNVYGSCMEASPPTVEPRMRRTGLS